MAFSKLRAEVENDVNACTLGKNWLGITRDVENFLCMALGTGIEGAIYKYGRIISGYRGVVAEFGHIVIDINGKQCA